MIKMIIIILLSVLIGLMFGQITRALSGMIPLKECYGFLPRIIGNITHPAYCFGVWLSKFDTTIK